MSSSQATYSPRVKLIHSLAEAYKRKDVNFIAKHVHKDYRRFVYPRSLGKSEQNAEEWLKMTAEMMNVWTGDSKLDVHSLIETPEKVFLHITVKAKTTIGLEVNRELMLFVNIVADEDGILKMKQIEAFEDSKTYLEFSKAIAEAQASRQRAQFAA